MRKLLELFPPEARAEYDKRIGPAMKAYASVAHHNDQLNKGEKARPLHKRPIIAVVLPPFQFQRDGKLVQKYHVVVAYNNGTIGRHLASQNSEPDLEALAKRLGIQGKVWGHDLKSEPAKKVGKRVSKAG